MTTTTTTTRDFDDEAMRAVRALIVAWARDPDMGREQYESALSIMKVFAEGARSRSMWGGEGGEHREWLDRAALAEADADAR
jgi:hypothetical protein